jgi:hypothetical protein
LQGGGQSVHDLGGLQDIGSVHCHFPGVVSLVIAVGANQNELVQPHIFHHPRCRTHIQGTCRLD